MLELMLKIQIWLALAEKGKSGALEAIVKGNRAKLVRQKVAPPGQRWVKIELTMDSGACEHVVHPEQITELRCA